ncbi:MAG: helix-turn-helix domain-containing protein [Candidatus Thorarchaeota archaeon]
MRYHNPLDSLFKTSFRRPSDFICCAFGLQRSEIDTYFALLSGEKSASEISAALSLDRSTVQRALKSLMEKQLVFRNKRSIEGGGYYYTYRAVSTEEIRSQILQQLDKWYADTRRFLMQSWSVQPGD